MKRPNLKIDVETVNDRYEHDEDNMNQATKMESTYRAEGLSIGRDYLRFEGKTIAKSISIDSFCVGKLIGRGVSSKVFYATMKDDDSQRKYALKEFHLDHNWNQDTFSHNDKKKKLNSSSMLVQEIKFLCTLRCDCLVELVGAFYDAPSTVVMAMEYMDCGSLEQFLHLGHDDDFHTNSSTPIIPTERAMAAISYQILWGLSFLHHENVIHRDLKPANILLNSKGQVKISDFGISTISAFAQNDQTLNHTTVGTTKYMSPERLLDKSYGIQSDIWSFGLIMIEASTGGWCPLSHNQANQKKNETHHRRSISSIVELAMIVSEFQVENVLNKLATRDDLNSIKDAVRWSTEKKGEDSFKEIIRWSLQTSPDKRIPAKNLLKSPWFLGLGITNIKTAQDSMRQYIESLESAL